MDIRFVMTPEGAGKKADEEAAKRACSYFRMDDMPVNPVLAFSFLEDRDWLNDYLAKELLKKSSKVAVCADEVTEKMITEIKLAQELGLPIRFYDADLHEINVDALVINKRIGPGLRKMIMDINGISCSTGGCPYGAGEVTKEPTPEETVPVQEMVIDSVAAPEKKSMLHRLFGRH